MSKSIVASGKRKKSVAVATLREGTGKVKVNSRLLQFYNPEFSRLKIQEPLIIADDVSSTVDIDVNVRGGGFQSQAEACRLAIAKGLVDYSKNKKLEKQFLSYDRTLLVADVRQREPRKPNSHGNARSKVQKSYR